MICLPEERPGRIKNKPMGCYGWEPVREETNICHITVESKGYLTAPCSDGVNPKAGNRMND